MKKIVITGGAGFIGSHIAEYWNSVGAEVIIIDDLRTGKLANISHLPGVRFFNGSVTDPGITASLLQGADAVYHFASMVSVPESFENPVECFQINTFGLLNLIAACVQQGKTKIIYSSSAAVYGDNPNLPLSTRSFTRPLSPYGSAKLSGEQLLQQYHTESGLQYVVFRHFNVFGPRQDPRGAYASVIPQFITRALANQDIVIFGDGEQVRDFIFVKDVVSANVLAVQKDTINGVFNVASGFEITINHLAELIVTLTGSKSRIIHQGKRKGDIVLSTSDISDTREKLGFENTFSIEQGLMETIAYYRTTITQ